MTIRGTRLEHAVDWTAVRLADPHGPWGRTGPLLAEALWRMTGLWSPSLRDSLGFPGRRSHRRRRDQEHRMSAPLPRATEHTPASHYGRALNAYAAWYVEHIQPGALFSRRYGFARAMVDQALALGWIPGEAPLRFADCTCPANLTRTDPED